MPALRNAIVLKLIEMHDQIVALACILHVIQYFIEYSAVIYIMQTAYILSEEPFRFEIIQSLHAVSIQRAELTVYTFSFAYYAEVVAGKAEC